MKSANGSYVFLVSPPPAFLTLHIQKEGKTRARITLQFTSLVSGQNEPAFIECPHCQERVTEAFILEDNGGKSLYCVHCRGLVFSFIATHKNPQE